MGVAIIGGLISSTILTLVVVPAAFGYIDNFRMWALRMIRGNKKTPPPDPESFKLEKKIPEAVAN